MVAQVGLRRYALWLTWVVVASLCFVVSSLAAELFLLAMQSAGIVWSLNTTVGALWFRLVVYLIALALFVGIIFKVRGLTVRELLKALGIWRPLTMRDVGLGLAGMVVYALLTMITQFVLQKIPGYDSGQAQNLGISTHLMGGEFIMAYIVLVVITPFCEELLFRGALYDALRDAHMGKWVAVIVVSALFGLAHGQWNVGMDVFCLSMLACYLRELTGTIWPGVMLHVAKNALAFWYVFVVLHGVTG